MQDVSEDMIRDIFSRQPDTPVCLVTITADGLDVPIRASSDPEGTTSRGEVFPYFPFTFAWGGAGTDEPVRQAKLEIGNTDGRIAEAIRMAESQPLVTIELVRRTAPDFVEMAMTGAKLADAEVDDPRASATLKPKSFADEPANQARYTMARTPALF